MFAWILGTFSPKPTALPKAILNEALIKAIQYFDTNKIASLLQKGADPDTQEPDRPLHLAARQGYTAATRLLLEADASVDAEDAHENTALYIAAFSNRTDVVKLLLAHGANVNAKNCSREITALHAAAINSHTTFEGALDIITILLEAGAEVNARNNNNETALILAAKANHYKAVKTFLKAGAEFDDAPIETIKASATFTPAEKASFLRMSAWTKRHALLMLRHELLTSNEPVADPAAQ